MAMILALVAAGASLVAFLAIPIAGGAVALAATAVLVRGHVPMRPSFRVSEWRELLRQALPFVVATAVNALYFRIAMIMLSVLATAEPPASTVRPSGSWRCSC